MRSGKRKQEERVGDIMEIKSKIKRCAYALPDFEGDKMNYYCLLDSSSEDHFCTQEECEVCENFNSKYIEYPVVINEIECKPIKHEENIGFLVEIQPCAKEYEDKTFLGIYLGHLPIKIDSSLDAKTGVLTNQAVTNPAIFVPKLRKIIYGCESWWRKIDSIEDLKGISKEDIENVWYVQLLRAMEAKEKN